MPLCIDHQQVVREKTRKPSIKFAHVFTKIPYGIQFLKTFVTSVTKIKRIDLTPEQIAFDTAIVGGGHYTLPHGELLHVKLWTETAEGGVAWNTYREFTEEKQVYYKNLCGREVCIIIEKQG